MKKTSLLLILLFFSGSVIAQSERDTVSNTADTTAVVITPPIFKSGSQDLNKYISENFVYPDDAKRRSVDGIIQLEITFEKSGVISYVGVIKGLDPSVDDEMVRLFKAMPHWTPGKKNGVPIRYKMLMPITFRASKRGTFATTREDMEELINDMIKERTDLEF